VALEGLSGLNVLFETGCYDSVRVPAIVLRFRFVVGLRSVNRLT
jgi:hypothetical protein